MPNKRILWFKLWIGSTRHEKVAQLDDRAFRVWVELLDGAAQQTVRGRYANVQAAAAVVRRPPTLIKRLLAVGLLDERDDGLWMHDWQDWQRWRPEDATNNDPSPTDRPPNDNPSTRDQHTMGSRSPGDQHTITNGTTLDQPSRAAERAKRGDGRVETGDERIETPPAPPERPPAQRSTVIDAQFTTELEDQFWEQFGSRDAVRDSIAAALSHKARLKYSDLRAYLRNWVRGDAERSQGRRGRVVSITGRSAGLTPQDRAETLKGRVIGESA